MDIRPLDDYMLDYITKVLKHYDGHRKATADALKISVRGLYTKLIRAEHLGYHVEPPKMGIPGTSKKRCG